METVDLQAIANRHRFMREAGVALLLSSAVLALFLFIPLQQEAKPAQAVSVASTTPDAFATVDIAAKAAIVYDLKTDQVLYSKNADAQLPLASLTKLLTVYTALSTLGPDATVTITPDAEQVDEPHAFSPGQQFNLTQLARLTLTGSLNDGAVAMADAAAAQKQESTPSLMASAAEGLGLSETYALNGSGLDESTTTSGGYGSAHDIALLAGALIAEAPSIVEATTQAHTQGTSEAGTAFDIKNTDTIVSTVPHLLLSKTGYTDLAGGNLALIFDVGIEHPVAIVLLGSTETARFTDGTTLVDATLAHFAGVPAL